MVMPRYFFDVRDAQGITRDLEGQDLETSELAVTLAVASIGEIAKDMTAGGQKSNLIIYVRDDAGRGFVVSAKIEVRDAFPEELRG